jgi:hypothetical protein
MTRQEKFVVFALLATLLLGAAVRSIRRGAADSTPPALNSSPPQP